MSQPTAYYPAYNFTLFQVSHPSTPLPAASLDSELFNVSISVTEICNNLALIQRDDGALANQSVGFNQLQSGLALGLAHPAVNWLTATAYVVNDTVYENNSIYVCAISHTSGVFATDLSNGDWVLMINTGQYVTAAAASAAAALVSQNAAAVSAAAALVSQTAAAASAVSAAASVALNNTFYVGAATGVDTITVTPTAAVAAWVTGMQLRFAAAGANATAAPTLNPSGIGAKNIKKVNGSGVVVAPAIGDIPANAHVVVEYDGTQALLLGAPPFSQSAAIATASTINLDNATGVYVPLTGVATVNVITLALGQFRRCVAGSAFTLTNGASLICPKAANIAVAAGDTFDAWGEAAGVVRITNYFPANGVANATLATMAANTVKMNNTGSTANAVDATMAQLNAVLLAVTSVKRQTFTSTGTYTPSAGMLYCDAEAWGGGGGGGGVSATAGACAAGGGAGGYVRKVITAAAIGVSQAVTIGAAGTAGVNTGGTGGTGGTTSLGAIITATGGAGGQGSVSAAISYNGGAGGVGSSGDVNATGQYGGASVGGTTIGISGFGGSTSLGGGGQAFGTQSSNPGNAGVANSGSGGSGAQNGSAATANVGGAGAKGYIVITEYCSQ